MDVWFRLDFYGVNKNNYKLDFPVFEPSIYKDVCTFNLHGLLND